MDLKPFFKYYGGKWRAARKYPAPKHDTIVEPFAGAAGYSLRYPDRQVILADTYPVITGIWEYLINASKDEILSLPDVGDDQTVDDLDVPQAARWLIGFWLNAGVASPCKRPSAWMRGGLRPGCYWGEGARSRIAEQLAFIRHWKIVPGSYDELPNVQATWYVDPPYQLAGKGYKESDVDYPHLAAWCQQRNGQTIVCENEGADWLPFRPLYSAQSTPGSKRSRKRTIELIWTPH